MLVRIDVDSCCRFEVSITSDVFFVYGIKFTAIQRMHVSESSVALSRLGSVLYLVHFLRQPTLVK